MSLNPSVLTVVKKVGGHVGKYRVQKYGHIGGIRTTVAEHRENGVRLRLDVSKVYFSPRLGHERLRIAGLVRLGERVLVIGSGVGPYPLVIARNSNAVEIFGVEANPVAHKFSLENAILNKLESRLVFIRGDALRAVPGLGIFDRVLVTAPQQSDVLLSVALKALKRKGILHFYTFSGESDFESVVFGLKRRISFFGRRVSSVSVVKCGQQSPRVWRVCLDVKLKN